MNSNESQNIYESASEMSIREQDSPMLVRHRGSERDMIESMAAETIQESYRRYKECLLSKREARVRRETAQVEHMAADTIKGALKAHLSHKKLDKENLEKIGWEKRYDAVKGRYYYVDHNEKKTQWKHPLRPKKKDKRKGVPAKGEGSPQEEGSPQVLLDLRVEDADAQEVVVDEEEAVSLKAEDKGGELTQEEVRHTLAELEPMAEPRAEPVGGLDAPEPVGGLDAPESEAVVEEEQERAQGEGGTERAHIFAPQTPANVDLPAHMPQLQKAYARLTPSGEHLVVDEAFSIAFQEQCNSVLLRPKEVVLLLDALESDVPEAVLQNADELSASVPPVELPVLHAEPLAAVLSTYARNYSLIRDTRSFTLAEDKSRLAVRRLCGLISGPWSDGLPAPVPDPHDAAREMLLRSAHGSHGKTARPLYWSAKQIKALLHATGFTGPAFDGLSGHDFLSLDAATALHERGISQSILCKRFCVYQELLRLLDKWWELGHRPGDVYRDAYRPSFLDSLKQPSFFVGSAGPRDGASKKSKANDQAAKKKERKRRGSFPGLRKNTENKFKWGNFEAPGPSRVEVAPLEALLQSWAPLNRAYGWGVTLDVLTHLGVKIGGKLGYVRSRGLPEIKGCCWVRLEDEALTSGLDVDIVKPSPTSPNHLLVLVPLMCLRHASENRQSLGSVRTALDLSDVTPGALLKVTGRVALERACDRFEWWDRPPPESIAAMANQTAEVISVNELSSRKRVGVRVVNSDLFDAVPLEALLPLEKGVDKEAAPHEGGALVAVSVPKVSVTAGRKPKPVDRTVKMAPAAPAGYAPNFVLGDSQAEGDKKPQRPQTAGAVPRRGIKKTPVVVGESEREMNALYLREVTAPMRGAFAPGGGHPEQGHAEVKEGEPEDGSPEGAVTHSSRPLSVDPFEAPAEARDEAPSSPSRVSQQELHFDSQGAKWAMPSADAPRNRKRRSLIKRGSPGRKLNVNVDGRGNDFVAKEKEEASLAVQQLGLAGLGDENFKNGLSPRRSKGNRQRPKTTAAEGKRVVGVPVLAGVEDVTSFGDGEGPFVVLGARRL